MTIQPATESPMPARNCILLLAAIVSCSESPSSAVVVRDSAGIRIVEAPAADRPLPWTFSEVARVGGELEGPGSFVAVNERLVRSDGADRFYVLDPEAKVVHAFGPDGESLGDLGRQGGGPGEFQMVFSFVAASPTEVAVFDFSKLAIVGFSPGGEPTAERRLPSRLEGWRSLVRSGDTVAASIDRGDSTGVVKELLLATPGDTAVIASIDGAPKRMIQLSCVSFMMEPFFSPGLAWALEGNQLLVANQAQYSIQHFLGDNLDLIVRRDIAARAATVEAVERQQPEGFRMRFGGGGECRAETAEVVEQAGLAPTIPVIDQVAFGPRETIWVARFTIGDEPKLVDVFDREGAYLGTTDRMPLGVLAGDRVLFKVADEDSGAEFVGIYAVRGD